MDEIDFGVWWTLRVLVSIPLEMPRRHKMGLKRVQRNDWRSLEHVYASGGEGMDKLRSVRHVRSGMVARKVAWRVAGTRGI